MENASKALLIAGGILLALITISLLIYAGTAMSDMAQAQDRAALIEQTEEFNKGYEAFNRARMYGADIITVSNKAEDNNITYSDDSNYHVEVSVFDENGNIINAENTQEFKMSIFQCIKVEYNENTGRISKMEFKRISLNN